MKREFHYRPGAVHHIFDAQDQADRTRDILSSAYNAHSLDKMEERLYQAYLRAQQTLWHVDQAWSHVKMIKARRHEAGIK